MPALKDIPPFAKGETWDQWRIATLDRVFRDARIRGEQRKREQERKPETPAAKPVFGKGKAA